MLMVTSTNIPLPSSINTVRGNERMTSPIPVPVKMENSGGRRKRVLLVSFCAQGHINPLLQFAKHLTRRGVHVTFVTSLSTYRRMGQTPTLPHLSFASFSDGYDDGFSAAAGHDIDHYLSEHERRGSQAVKDMIVESVNQGQPFTCVVYSIFIPWVAAVARSLHLTPILLWIQPAIVFDLYYYYYNGYQDAILNISGDPLGAIQLPGLPLLTGGDLPSFFRSSNVYDFVIPMFRKQFEILEQETNPIVLLNTFDDLEHDALRLGVTSKFRFIPIGPLVPSAFLDGKDPSDVSFGGDMFQCTGKDDYIEWLNSKPKASVVYVSSGSIAKLSKQQKEEMAWGLLGSRRPFLWVMRDVGDSDALSCMDELEAQGKIVSWCSQLEVLSSSATGCFLTHGGWNSCLESLACGVPAVVFPQWSDQGTNAKIIQDLSKTGVRLEVAIEGVVKREEIRRCLELVMGDSDEGEEIRRNAVKWKELARKAAGDGGSSDENFKAFVDQICRSN